MSRIAAILVGAAVLMSAARLGALIFVPAMALDIPIALIIARPTGEVIALSTSSDSGLSVILVGILAISSRLALDMTTFYASRYGLRYFPRPWKIRVSKLRRKIPARWVLPVSLLYSATPIMMLLGILRVAAHRVFLQIFIGNTIVVLSYIAAALAWSAQLQNFAQIITEYRYESVFVIISLIGILIVWKNRSSLCSRIIRRPRDSERIPS
ncbi:hypothetical protein BKP42_54070 [Rhodococcus erythropolis]|nr:hypothetical protein BKP42_54070 [Rhodococcus erythropolis]